MQAGRGITMTMTVTIYQVLGAMMVVQVQDLGFGV